MKGSMARHSSTKKVEWTTRETGRIVMLKNGHSGSSWLAKMLERIPRFFFMRETINNTTAKGRSLDEILEHLNVSLRQPRGKIHKPSDFTPPPPNSLPLEAIGFSINPIIGVKQRKQQGKALPLQESWKYLEGVEEYISNLGDTHSNSVVVVLHRTNVVKQALSTSGSKVDAKRPNAIEVNPCDLLIDTEEFFYRNRLLLELANRLQEKTKVKIIQFSYEEMQQIKTEILHRILKPINVGIPEYTKDPGTRKASSEDLRQRISNFDTVEEYFRLNADPLFLKMLHSTTPEVFPTVK